MKWRVAIAVLLALALGVAGGWFYANAQDEPAPVPTPTPLDIAPVPATPSLPIVVPSPDSDEPPLETNIELSDQTLDLDTDNGVYTMTLPAPTSWGKPTFDGANDRWNFTKPGNSNGAYGLRVDIIADRGETVATALSARIAALESAERQDNLSDLDIQVLDTQNGFDATYIDPEGLRRVSVERIFDGGPDGTAFAQIAGFGRTSDENGLQDLVALVTRDRTVQNP